MNYQTAKSTLTSTFPWRMERRAAERTEDAVTIDHRVAGLQAWKRATDITLSVIALALLSPVIAVTALLVKATSRGPVFFKQERVGLDRRVSSGRRDGDSPSRSVERRLRDRRQECKYGSPFTMYKFRTMVIDAEKGKAIWAQKNDPRITYLGRILRRCRIDELPQFINVIKGEMSIVGPRPERVFFMDEARDDIPNFSERLRTKPGITGLAQVQLGYTNSVKGLGQKLQLDLEYIRGLSLANDLKILLRTITVVLTGKGAC